MANNAGVIDIKPENRLVLDAKPGMASVADARPLMVAIDPSTALQSYQRVLGTGMPMGLLLALNYTTAGTVTTINT